MVYKFSKFQSSGRQRTVQCIKMRFQIILLLAVISYVSAKFEPKTKSDALQAHEDCREEFNVPDDIYEKFLNYEFPEHRRTSCYIKCFVEKMGLFTELKGFNERFILNQFTSKDTKDLPSVRHGLEKCIDHNEWESDTCTWADRVFSCWLKVNRHVVRKVYGED